MSDHVFVRAGLVGRVRAPALLGLLLAPALLCLLLAPAPARATLLTTDDTPFPPSTQIVGAAWTSPRYAPPSNQRGDILPTVWADDGYEYTMMDDGGTDAPPGDFWKQSLARITGTPPRIRFVYVGDPRRPAPHSVAQIRRDRSLWSGPVGPYYSSGLVQAGGDFFATQERDWSFGADGLFAGLAGIAYSTDHGQSWHSPGAAFPAPLGNLSWVIRGRGGNYPDGWVYAIATEREFNATRLIMGRARPAVADITNPARWEWVASPITARGGAPAYSSSPSAAWPIADWPSHITYPQMAYDSAIHRYLLTFTYSYGLVPEALWRNGSELVILDAPHPWGPFSFVGREPWFGPSNGYGAGFPIGWISRDGRTLWLKWAANFDGCSAHLNCSGGYGFNYRRLQLTLAGDPAATPTPAHRASVTGHTRTHNTRHARSAASSSADAGSHRHARARRRRPAQRRDPGVRLRGLP